MKYGNIIFDGNRNTSINIGDDMQLLAIEYLYDLMDIPKEKRIRIPFSELTTYGTIYDDSTLNNEYIILPISFPLYGYRNQMNITVFSPKIIPVFLGLSIMTSFLTDKDVSYLKRFEPIGCRDIHTMNILRSYDIEAYLNGCMTAIFPRISDRKSKPSLKTFIVDIPSQFLKYIPKEIKEKAVFTSQVLDHSNNPEKDVKKQYKWYKDEAKLIITTRLHCAWPCIAAGIPVILMKRKFSFRFTALEKLLHQYTEDEFNKIDFFDVQPPNYESLKENLIQNAKFQISKKINEYTTYTNISSFYESKYYNKKPFIEHFDNVIDDVLSKWETEPDKIRQYAFWGLTQKAEMLYTYIKKKITNSKFMGLYDRDKSVDFFGVKTTQNIEILLDNDTYVFVTAATANSFAITLFNSHNKTNFYISTDGIGE